MATYFDGNAEMQANGDGLQTLLLMNQQQQPSNLVFLNASSAVNHSNPPPSQTHHHQYQDVSAREEVKQGLSLSLSPQQAAEEVNVVLSCKYLKAAQELLDEVVCTRKNGRQSATTADQSSAGDGRDKLSTAEKQEIQMKKAKLLNMLHQVEQRYKQYQHEMQMVISWFEQAAGEASAKTYTALALQTISKQFRSLKDAVLAQIRVLGQQHTLRGLMEGSSRLKYIDTHHREGNGMIQHNAWTPQRGLPERSVSVLRAWLLDHFLHPYPKDTDKIMLAKQTGLTRTQVSNWFINARVRLWKPMVTEMYTEEVKGHQHHNIAGKTKHLKLPKPKEAAETEINNNTSSTAADVENQHIAMNFFASYPMEHFRPSYSGSGVSLTLGLQHCENLPNQDFMSNQTMNLEPAGRNHFAPSTSAHAHDSIPVYDSIDVQTSNKRFAAQLLPDFVT